MNDPEAAHHHPIRWWLGIVAAVVGGGAVAAGGEDGDAFLAGPDLSAELLPGAVSGHLAGPGGLAENEQHVVGRVAVQLGGHGQKRLPVVAADQGLDGLGQAVVGFGQLVGTVVVLGPGHGGLLSA